MSLSPITSYEKREGGSWFFFPRKDCLVDTELPLLKEAIQAILGEKELAAITTLSGHVYDFTLGSWIHLYQGKNTTETLTPKTITIGDNFSALGQAAICREEATAIEKILAERGSRYGSFSGHADITQRLKAAMKDSPNWPTLSDSQKEALEMVAHKIGRILNGDPNYLDSWVDIVGYTQLIVDQLNGKNT